MGLMCLENKLHSAEASTRLTTREEHHPETSVPGFRSPYSADNISG